MDETLHVVLHFPYESIKTVIETKLSKHCEATIWYEHPPQRREVQHCHGYIKKLSVSRQTVKDWITKELGVKPTKNDWAFMTEIAKGDKKGQPVDIDSITYFSKGQYKHQYKHNIDDETVAKYEALSYKPPEKVASGTKKSHTDRQLEKKGLTHWDIVEWVRERAHKTKVLKKDMFGYMIEADAYADYGQIYDLLVQKLEECKIKTHQSDLERWYCTIIRNDASPQAVIKDNIMAKYSRRV